MSDVFDPEKIERYESMRDAAEDLLICASTYPRAEHWKHHENWVLASDYDTLLKMYQDKCGESADLE